MNIFFLAKEELFQIGIFILAVVILIRPLGFYMAKVYNDQFVLLEKILGPIESLFYNLAKINPTREMNWQQYAYAIIIFSSINFFVLFIILKTQFYLPLNPQKFANLNSDLAFNTAVSFITNTNWQSYGGENTLSYFSQMIGLTVQNFISAGIGMAVAIALIRGITRRNCNLIGNFWVDLLRGILYILLPMSFVLSIILASEGVIQNFNKYTESHFIDSNQSQLDVTLIPGGPVASQVAIKQLGSNGGGFFATNSAYPFENPTSFSNFLELLAIILIPSALCYTFGIMINDKKQSLAILTIMTIIFIPLAILGIQQEKKENIGLSKLNIDQIYSNVNLGGNMEGKEVRFGVVSSSLWASVTTATSNGSVNSMHDSFTPFGGAIPLFFLLLGEIIFGGVGAGLYGILLFIFLTVFIAGLMAGRTPEYLGKKIQSDEIKMVSIAILIPVITLLFGTSMAIFSSNNGILNPGPHGFTEILYALASTTGNNGSAFAGLSTNTPFYNVLLGIVMLVNRYWTIILVLAIAGSLVKKNASPANNATLSTNSILFITFMICIIIAFCLLTYIPAVILGPMSDSISGIRLEQ